MDDLQYPDLFSEKGSTTPVLNLIINGWPSILNLKNYPEIDMFIVLNLIINGWPSILEPNEIGWEFWNEF